MKASYFLALFSAFAALSAGASSARRPAKRSYGTHDYYVLEFDSARGISIEECAATLGAEVVEPVGELPNYWLLRSQKDGMKHTLLERLRALQGAHSGSLDTPPTAPGLDKRSLVPAAVKRLELQVPRQRVKRAAIPAPLPQDDGSHSLARDIAARLGIEDPLFPSQWHLVNDDNPEHMLNATPLWDIGIMGEGVISALVDDGLEFESEDLKDNFDAEGSHDFNDHVDLPKPMLYDDHHGTRCAGQIAAVKNGVCGVGIAYKSKVAGIRILSGPITDVDEAAALNFGYHSTSIYSCSWGPSDDGMSMEAPNYLIRKAILNGVQNGRDGKGSIYVFASGNGAYAGDQCNFDGYTNSIYSVTVGAIDYEGKHPYYSEGCAANMVVTYSSGSNVRKSIVTTDIGKDKCTSAHGGTSAAAPNAVGIFALALSVRPDLSWRDIQYLCVHTAKVINPADSDWELTATGRPYSYKYGFGKLDAYEYVMAAQKWKLVKPQAWIELPPVQVEGGTMDKDGHFEGGRRIKEDGIKSEIEITPQMLRDNNFDSLEHVTVKVWIQHTRRGDVEVELTGPHGVSSVLAEKRRNDKDPDGFRGWKFMSVKHWGENPIGKWTIKVSDQDDEDENGHFIGWSLTLWGSVDDASKEKPYILTDTDELPFPPPEPEPSPEPTTIAASTTKSYLKPTVISTTSSPTETTDSVHEDVVSTTQTDAASQSTDKTGQNDSISSDESTMNDETRFYIGIVGYVAAVLMLAGALFLIVRQIRRRRRNPEYSRVSETEDMHMRSIEITRVPSGSGSGRSRHADVIYDADEEMALAGSGEHNVSSDPVGFHSGFLDDEEAGPNNAGPSYSDTPKLQEEHEESDAPSPRGKGV